MSRNRGIYYYYGNNNRYPNPDSYLLDRLKSISRLFQTEYRRLAVTDNYPLSLNLDKTIELLKDTHSIGGLKSNHNNFKAQLDRAVVMRIPLDKQLLIYNMIWDHTQYMI